MFAVVAFGDPGRWNDDIDIGTSWGAVERGVRTKAGHGRRLTAQHLAAVGPSALRWQGGHPVSRSVLFVLRDRRSRKLKRTIPRWVWALPLGLGLAASVLSPIVWNMQHGVEGVLTEADEASLSCSVEAACGALRGPVTLLQVTVPELLPDDVQPPGYADCAARHVGTAFGPEIRLTPCKSPAR